VAHFVGDFLLQTGAMAAAKKAGRFWAHFRHGLLIMILTWLATHCFGLWAAFLYALLVGLTHFLIDSTKCCLEKGKSAGTQLLLFLLDQALHWLSLLVFLPLFPAAVPDPQVLAFYRRFRPVQPVFSPAFPAAFSSLSLEKSLWIIVIYLAAVFGGAIFTKRVLAWLTDNHQGERDRRLSSAIGIMERLILITLVAADAISAMGFVLAAKSLARYQELNNREFAEYYLVGTLTSFTLALFAGLWLRAILQK